LDGGSLCGPDAQTEQGSRQADRKTVHDESFRSRCIDNTALNVPVDVQRGVNTANCSVLSSTVKPVDTEKYQRLFEHSCVHHNPGRGRQSRSRNRCIDKKAYDAVHPIASMPFKASSPASTRKSPCGSLARKVYEAGSGSCVHAGLLV
jgi:hypothetical protein